MTSFWNFFSLKNRKELIKYVYFCAAFIYCVGVHETFSAPASQIWLLNIHVVNDSFNERKLWREKEKNKNEANKMIGSETYVLMTRLQHYKRKKSMINIWKSHLQHKKHPLLSVNREHALPVQQRQQPSFQSRVFTSVMWSAGKMIIHSASWVTERHRGEGGGEYLKAQHLLARLLVMAFSRSAWMDRRTTVYKNAPTLWCQRCKIQ